MNTATVLDLIAAREAATSGTLDELREQQAKLAAEVAGIVRILVRFCRVLRCWVRRRAGGSGRLIRMISWVRLVGRRPLVVSGPIRRDTAFTVMAVVARRRSWR
ncbi:hypothetical protein [Actinoplanes sp. NBRC 103695]|uniref:hypothetical protein n=1 Tax=Actinoplanes sp. NBRC 103695 TaxID=3032202 RepID=UPI0024A46162|nr:hypothetical protein [Actinoplanes sp. NBRC 103695]GLZ02329.1 hypothetical protein Acsp02_95800 [Actinoplanes sp. NBRC 103695]